MHSASPTAGVAVGQIARGRWEPPHLASRKSHSGVKGSLPNASGLSGRKIRSKIAHQPKRVKSPLENYGKDIAFAGNNLPQALPEVASCELARCFGAILSPRGICPIRQRADVRYRTLPAGYPPSQVLPATALVGLLTSASEVPAFSSRQAQTNNAHHDNGHKEGGTSHIHGYSGGAVPDLHRSSLFVGYPRGASDHQRSSQHEINRNYDTDQLFVKSRFPQTFVCPYLAPRQHFSSPPGKDLQRMDTGSGIFAAQLLGKSQPWFRFLQRRQPERLIKLRYCPFGLP